MLQAVAGGADFLIDLEAALQGAAVIGAERAFEAELLILGMMAGGGAVGRESGCRRQKPKTQTERHVT